MISTSVAPTPMAGKRPNDSKKGAWIPWLFVGFFGIVLVVNGIMIWIALSTWNGLAAQRSFDKGLAYNRNIEAARAQAKLGWQTVVELDGKTLVVGLRDREDRSVTGATLAATFERPNDEQLDFSIALTQRGDGLYEASLVDVQPGRWNVHLVATKGDKRMVTDQWVVLQ